MRVTAPFFAAFALAALASCAAAPETPSSPIAQEPAPGAVAIPAPVAPATTGYTLAQVSAHADRTSCWAAVNGSVYDLTPFFGKHPGGDGNLAKLCGKDGTALFTGKHGGQARPTSELASLKIGVLSK